MASTSDTIIDFELRPSFADGVEHLPHVVVAVLGHLVVGEVSPKRGQSQVLELGRQHGPGLLLVHVVDHHRLSDRDDQLVELRLRQVPLLRVAVHVPQQRFELVLVQSTARGLDEVGQVLLVDVPDVVRVLLVDHPPQLVHAHVLVRLDQRALQAVDLTIAAHHLRKQIHQSELRELDLHQARLLALLHLELPQHQVRLRKHQVSELLEIYPIQFLK